MTYKKKLIEVALPLDAINAESAREKSIRHGHPSALHLWWSRKPLATARAVLFASLVDDPSAHPEDFPTEEAQERERQRLFHLIEKLIIWENSTDKELFAQAYEEIKKSTGDNPPPVFDPFAGGGTIPLEAQRLGLKAIAADLNPVAVIINKAMIEIPVKFQNKSPVNPVAKSLLDAEWHGTRGLADDIAYYGKLLKEKAYADIGHFYPKVTIPGIGQKAVVIAWKWARTVMCPNPACRCEMPLVNSFWLSKKAGKEAYLEPMMENDKIRFEVRYGKGKVREGTVARTGATCIACGASIPLSYIRNEAKKGCMSAQLIAIVAESQGGRLYLAANEEHKKIADMPLPEDVPVGDLPEKALGFRVQEYGITKYSQLFTKRQLMALTTFSDRLIDIREQVCADGGTKGYSEAIVTYLAFLVDQLANHGSVICGWNSPNQQLRNTFARQAIPMVWDFAESNPFCRSSGSFHSLYGRMCEAFQSFMPSGQIGMVYNASATADLNVGSVVLSTDPPYYDNIGYADLSDFFYIWLRRNLKEIYPEIFSTMLVPKKEELVATPYRFAGSQQAAKEFFEQGMFDVCQNIYRYATQDIPLTIYYAFKQTDMDVGGTTSSGWETMLSAIIQAGFSINGTWPIRTEKPGRSVSIGTNALASSIVLVCRKRPADAPICTRRDFLTALKRELRPALVNLQQSNIAPVDMAQSAIGPGMAVYSRYAQVLEADGTPMTVRTALQIINQELDQYFSEQDGALDRDTIFCVALYTQYAFREVKFGDVDVLARAKNTSTDRLREKGILYAERGTVRLLQRDEMASQRTFDVSVTWQVVQRLAHALDVDGVEGAAQIVVGLSSEAAEKARALAYRLFQTAERRGWAQEAYAYNTLVTNWRAVQEAAARIKKEQGANQGGLFAE